MAPGGALVKNPPDNAGDIGDAASIPGSRRSPAGGNGKPLQNSCLKNSITYLVLFLDEEIKTQLG